MFIVLFIKKYLNWLMQHSYFEFPIRKMIYQSAKIASHVIGLHQITCIGLCIIIILMINYSTNILILMIFNM